MYRVVEGETLQIHEDFVDDFKDPYLPAEGQAGPIVILYDKRGDDPEIVTKKYATPDPNIAGRWVVDLGVPVLDLTDLTDFQITWVLLDDEGSTHTIRHVLQVEPSSQNRVTDIIATLLPQVATHKFSFSLPFPYDEDRHEVSISIYRGNEVILSNLDIENTDKIKVGRELTRVTINASLSAKNLSPHTMLIDFYDTVVERQETLTYKIWAVTPQVMTAASMVEDYINKARLENVIPELEFTQQDTIICLHRGLNLLNKMPPRVTAFTGMNMMGVLLDNWVTCSCYYALGMQLQAEGALAFDFSGQTVSFNVDRSPSIEAALGRVEQEIEQNIKMSKGLLCKAGYMSGDGSRADNYISGAQSFGRLGLSASPTTKRNLRMVRPRVNRL